MSKKRKSIIPVFAPAKVAPQAPGPLGVRSPNPPPPVTAIPMKPQATSAKSGRRGQ